MKTVLDMMIGYGYALAKGYRAQGRAVNWIKVRTIPVHAWRAKFPDAETYVGLLDQIEAGVRARLEEDRRDRAAERRRKPQPIAALESALERAKVLLPDEHARLEPRPLPAPDPTPSLRPLRADHAEQLRTKLRLERWAAQKQALRAALIKGRPDWTVKELA